MQEEQATEATLQRMLHGGRQCRRRTFCREQWYSLSLSLTLIRVLTFALRSRKSRGEQAAWRPVASEANPLYCRPTRQGVFRSKRRKTEVSTPLLYNRAERVCKAGGLFQLTVIRKMTVNCAYFLQCVIIDKNDLQNCLPYYWLSGRS